MSQAKEAPIMTPILIGGCLILVISFGIRATFGVFQIPIASEFDWPRTEFSLAIAIQNLAWGIGQPLFGAMAERFGDRKAIILGVFCYALGLALSAHAITPGAHQFLEILVGCGIAGTGFGVILAMVGRATSESKRSMALGIATAAGSAGQVIGPPVANFLLQFIPWQQVFIIFAVCILASLFFLSFMRQTAPIKKEQVQESMNQALLRALRDPNYALIFFGFFSCGYQLAFVTAHFPAMITEIGAQIDPSGILSQIGIHNSASLGAFSIALIGSTNIAGTILAGWLGQRFSRKYLLALIYFGRTIISALFIIMPITPASVILFSLGMGSLWLATIPLTSGLVGYIYGIRYMGTLYGIVFFSHQLGSFFGVWLGGKMYDIFGNYETVWWIGVGVGLLSALLHLPVKERPAPIKTVVA